MVTSSFIALILSTIIKEDLKRLNAGKEEDKDGEPTSAAIVDVDSPEPKK